MPDALEIEPFDGVLDATVAVPGSKSFTNRALVLAALARGRSTLHGALMSDDTRYMAGALDQLGFQVEVEVASSRFVVDGGGGRVPSSDAEVFIGNAGTAARFLPVLMSLGQGHYGLDGVPRMHQRPIAPLIEALNALGGQVRSVVNNDAVPLEIEARGLEGGTVQIPGDLSSQYITGLLMGAPFMRRGLKLEVLGELVSKPYVTMTLRAMGDFGVRVQREGWSSFSVAPGGPGYVGRDYVVEPDASAASYFFAAAAILGGRARVTGLGRGSLQGDLELVHILGRMGCAVQQDDEQTVVTGPPDGRLRGVEVDMANLSDVAQTLAVVAPFAESPTRVTGIGFIRRKETDRVAATVRELNRLGVDAVEEADGFLIHPGRPRPATVETYDDHRMAMSFALIGLCVPGVSIENPACTAKTFPDYWRVWADLRAGL